MFEFIAWFCCEARREVSFLQELAGPSTYSSQRSSISWYICLVLSSFLSLFRMLSSSLWAPGTYPFFSRSRRRLSLIISSRLTKKSIRSIIMNLARMLAVEAAWWNGRIWMRWWESWFMGTWCPYIAETSSSSEPPYWKKTGNFH